MFESVFLLSSEIKVACKQNLVGYQVLLGIIQGVFLKIEKIKGYRNLVRNIYDIFGLCEILP